MNVRKCDIYTENGITEWSINAAEEEFACLACLIGYEEDDEDDRE